ncbi:hypothetical protein FQR65_LT07979 [Abscondita terminalis]|nr:hypothetical protein FQR65_LT07979 [Abscondita terminalis]
MTSCSRGLNSLHQNMEDRSGDRNYSLPSSSSASSCDDSTDSETKNVPINNKTIDEIKDVTNPNVIKIYDVEWKLNHSVLTTEYTREFYKVVGLVYVMTINVLSIRRSTDQDKIFPAPPFEQNGFA